MLKMICAVLLVSGGLGYECLAQEGGRQSPAAQAAGDVQPRGETIRLARLRELMSAVGVSVDEAPAAPRGGGHREVSIVWEADPSSKGEASAPEASAFESRRDSFGHTLRVAGTRRRAGAPPRHRSPELSQDKLMVAAVGAGGKLRWWTLVDDPRLIRAEGPGPDGVLTGQVLYRAAPEFVVAVPDDRTITELRLYHPRWTGEEFVLDLINTVSVQ